MTTGMAAQTLCKADADECADTIRRQLAGQRYLGITMVETPLGTVVDAVLRNSPASRSGLRPNDRIIAINGRDCAGSDAQEIKRILTSEREPEPPWITIVIARLGQFHRIRVKLEPLTRKEIETIVNRHLEAAHREVRKAERE